jgi:DNA-binding MarR family transcriptional regulator
MITPVPFLTNHAYVLAALYRDPDIRQRDIARQIGITEGAVQRLLHELAESGHITIERVGRRNRYQVITSAHLRHPLESDRPVQCLLDLLAGDGLAANDKEVSS